MPSYWESWLAERFPDREVLDRDSLHAAFGVDLPRGPFGEFLDWFELEYSVSAGILRPSDELRQLSAPIATRNPLEWLAVEPGLEDKASELRYQLERRSRRTGVTVEQAPETIGDYVRIWCGLPAPYHPHTAE